MTEEELRFLEALTDESLMVSSPLWRARRDLILAREEHDEKITMQQAEMLRTLVGKLLLKRFPVAGLKFAESHIGQFPFVRKEAGAA